MALSVIVRLLALPGRRLRRAVRPTAGGTPMSATSLARRQAAAMDKNRPVVNVATSGLRRAQMASRSIWPHTAGADGRRPTSGASLRTARPHWAPTRLFRQSGQCQGFQIAEAVGDQRRGRAGSTWRICSTSRSRVGRVERRPKSQQLINVAPSAKTSLSGPSPPRSVPGRRNRGVPRPSRCA